MKSQKRVDSLKSSLYAMDYTVFAEIRRYHKPHPLVRQVVRSVLLLLGEHEGRIQVCIKIEEHITDLKIGLYLHASGKRRHHSSHIACVVKPA